LTAAYFLATLCSISVSRIIQIHQKQR